MKHISFPSIEQFRHIIATIKREAEFIGLDETGEAIYDESRIKPTLTFTGTVKLHGTNMGICFNREDGLWVQSRESIITPEDDNAGVAAFVESNKLAIINLFVQVEERYDIDLYTNTVSIYGEWAGKGIQKGVGINNLQKSIFIIGLKITPFEMDKEHPAYWLDSSFLKDPNIRIYNIQDYKKYSIDIDFNDPKEAYEKIVDMTIEVENECPVAKTHGYSGIGEGIVFSHTTQNGNVYRFKSKGEKHSKASKVKDLKPVDNEKVNKIIDVVNQITPDWRLEQALDKTFNLLNGGRIDIKKMGEFIKNVIADIVKEESDLISANGLELKETQSKISERCRNYFFAKENEAVGLK